MSYRVTLRGDDTACVLHDVSVPTQTDRQADIRRDVLVRYGPLTQTVWPPSLSVSSGQQSARLATLSCHPVIMPQCMVRSAVIP